MQSSQLAVEIAMDTTLVELIYIFNIYNNIASLTGSQCTEIFYWSFVYVAIM